MMQIKLYGYEIQDMIKDYLEVKYDLKIDLEKDCFDYPIFEYIDPVYAYKKIKTESLKNAKMVLKLLIIKKPNMIPSIQSSMMTQA